MKHAMLFGSLLLAAPGLSFAELRYSNFEVNLVDVELEVGPVDLDGEGFEVSGSYELNDRLFLFGEWQDLDFDFGIDGRSLEFGAGVNHAINPDLDLVATLSYVDVEVKLAGNSADDNGLALGGGIRARISDSFQIDALLRYVDLDDSGSDTGIAVMGRYYFTPKFAVSFGADLADDTETLRVGFRAEF